MQLEALKKKRDREIPKGDPLCPPLAGIALRLPLVRRVDSRRLGQAHVSEALQKPRRRRCPSLRSLRSNERVPDRTEESIH